MQREACKAGLMSRRCRAGALTDFVGCWSVGSGADGYLSSMGSSEFAGGGCREALFCRDGIAYARE